jgi:hypothetical protein
MNISLKSKVLVPAAIAAAGAFALVCMKRGKAKSENAMPIYPHTAEGDSTNMTTPHAETAIAIDPPAQSNNQN